MLRNCLSCGHPFGEGRLPAVPHGTRVAYAPETGRLWQVCERCRAWSLVPIEARWEALEALEREVRDRGRVLASTAHVSLVATTDLDITRVGPAARIEHAWWRFGERLRRRRSRYRRLAKANTVLSFLLWPDITLASFGMNRDRELADRAPAMLQKLARRARFGRHAWRGALACGTCGSERDRLSFGQADSLRLVLDEDAAPRLAWRCARCRGERWGWVGPKRIGEKSEGVVEPLPAEATEPILRRFLTRANFRGASEAQIERAADAIARVGDPRAHVEGVGRRGLPLAELAPSEGVALEMALSEAVESRWLDLDAAEAERQWRRAEELAAIIDGELT